MKIYRITLIALLTVLSSCTDFLELEPEYLANEASFYQTEADFETAILGNYSELQNIYNASLLKLTELTTDNAYVQWTSPTASEFECDEMRLTSANTEINSVWNLSFKTIVRCNTVIEKIENLEIDESLKRQYQGESYFLRAYNYFNLVRLFGDLPLIEGVFNSPDEIATFDMTRRPISEIYSLIISDLEQASTLLQGVELSKSRASSGAAEALLGKVYLTQNNFTEALATLKLVIDSGSYDLQDDYGSMFSNNNDELQESIFEIKYTSGNIGEGNDFSRLFTPPSFNAAIFPGNMNGSGIIVPTLDVRDSYEDGDLRRELSIKDSLLLLDGTYEQLQYGLKFVDFTVGLAEDGGINFTPLRYADVLLMYAECLNELDRTGEGYPFINAIRDRAGLDDLSGLSKEEFALALEKERRVEFLSEGHRWFDLVRTGRSLDVLNSYFQKIGTNFSVTQDELLMPLPQREMDIDPNLKQNPGY
ncbi:RagB/SusD family nutrient uptake outer membrane protein [Aurantibacter crassamenti]|uniref:RagB/SusD family nutrient uptake outer membrane protein n=1 Tax=Aurantibacter crassamenti TaxID=1837375 RepID=UPI00193952FE|nr:RagB/SusD family nutrient uptake outer membrane protein [Aurantibacter crassamenti]MBM1106257.1 RagB/SusD family nutrient uptake outer membrane protein [Aurantibacter crassamenti]